MKFEINTKIPRGFVPTGEYRYPGYYEYFLGYDGKAIHYKADAKSFDKAIILRKKNKENLKPFGIIFA